MPILDWLGKDEAVRAAQRVPYRLIEAVPGLSYGDPASSNMLIQGDNLDALKALLPHYSGRVKCVFVDPPYNTKSAFEHYDDNLEHSQWLSMIYPRLDLIRELLSEDGSLWITIDDNEAHYLKLLVDEVFGRKNFVASIAWQKVFAKKNKALVSGSHDHLFVICKDVRKWERNLLPRDEKSLSAFKNLDDDPRGQWQSVAYSVQSEDSERRRAYRYKITTPSGKNVSPPTGRHWNGLPDRTEQLIQENRLWFGSKGDKAPRMKVFLSEVQSGIVPDTWWSHETSGSNQDSKKEMIQLFEGLEPFNTPKPEKLLFRILTIASNPGDTVLDSFLGSGTTAAVAHKMSRRYIGIEMGEHAVNYCQPRLEKVVNGEQGGISREVDWSGGGGFHFYRLGAPVFDETGSIQPDIDFRSLAAFIWYLETKTPLTEVPSSALLGSYQGVGYYLLFNGILGDRRPKGGNVLTSAVLADLPRHEGQKVIYGEMTRFGDARLEAEGITFKQIPYDVRMR